MLINNRLGLVQDWDPSKAIKPMLVLAAHLFDDHIFNGLDPLLQGGK